MFKNKHIFNILFPRQKSGYLKKANTSGNNEANSSHYLMGLFLLLLTSNTYAKLSKNQVKQSQESHSISYYNASEFQKTTPGLTEDWQRLESNKMPIKVLSQIVKCENHYKVHLALHNDTEQEQAANFYLQVFKYAGSEESFTRMIHTKVPKLKAIQSECGNEENIEALSFTLPKDYNPTQVVLKVISTVE